MAGVLMAAAGKVVRAVGVAVVPTVVEGGKVIVVLADKSGIPVCSQSTL